MRRAGNLSAALVVLTLAAGSAHAQAPPASAFDLITSGLTDAPSYWAEPGRPGMTSQAWWGTAMPWTLAGFAAGSWSLELPGHVESPAFPGVRGVSSMLGMLDSLDMRIGAGGATAGFEGTLATAYTVPEIPRQRRTRGFVQIGSGDFGFDENALAIERGDSLRGLRAEVVSGSRGPAGSLARAGHHAWQVTGRWARGPHRLEAGFGDRGAAMVVQGGEEQSAGGDAGYVRYRRVTASTMLGATVERGYDRHESFGGLRFLSRRDAQATRGSIDAAWSGTALQLSASAQGGESEVHRQDDDAFATRARWAWGSVSAALRLGPGDVVASMGAGHMDVLGGIDTAPSLDYRVTRGPWQARAGVERTLWSAWSDLAPGEEPFLQSTWAGVAEVRRVTSSLRLHATALAGQSRDRALVTREPIEDLWLRDGWHPDPDDYRFALGMMDAEWTGRRFGWNAEGFGLARRASLAQPRVDPSWGVRGEAEYRVPFFGGDLGVHFRAGVEAVGTRESEALVSRTLPAYATSIAGITATLADAVVSLRVRNLENRIHEETWLDTSTLTEALGTGRELRFLVTVRLAN